MLQVLAVEPERPGLLRPLIEVASLAARWVPEHPGPCLDELAHTEQSLVTHGVATAMYALALDAVTAAPDGDRRVGLVLVGLLADAGKSMLPESALLRAGIHTVTAVRAARWHHERWAGGGYPDGLEGAAIPPEARLPAIADAFAALTADRPFTSGVRGYEALMEMARTEGQFEPGRLRMFVTAIGQALPAQQQFGAA